MKFKKSDLISRVRKIPDIRFEADAERSLTSFAGLVIFQKLFVQLGPARRLGACFAHLRGGANYSAGVIALWLLVHQLLGFRRLRDRDYYADDPLVQRMLGLTRLPDDSTISRTLSGMDEAAVANDRVFNREIVLDRLEAERLARVTLDFDGSVLCFDCGAAAPWLSELILPPSSRANPLRSRQPG